MVKLMKVSKWKEWVFIFHMIGCVQFIVLTFTGMLCYAGGTMQDPLVPGYSFFQNFFSEIGLTIARSGESNLISFVLFSLAFFIVGISLVPSFVVFPILFKRKKLSLYLTVLGSCIGIFTACCFSGITFAPADINGPLHSWFVRAGFISGLFVSILYSAAIFINKSYPMKYGFNFLFFTVVLAAYIILMFTGPSVATFEGLTIQATGQKIVLYTFAVCLLIHGYGACKEVKN